MKSILAATALLGGLAFGTAAHADPITYQFDIDPLFVGEMAGTFTFNAATNQESNVSITIASNPDDGGCSMVCIHRSRRSHRPRRPQRAT